MASCFLIIPWHVGTAQVERVENEKKKNKRSGKNRENKQNKAKLTTF